MQIMRLSRTCEHGMSARIGRMSDLGIAGMMQDPFQMPPQPETTPPSAPKNTPERGGGHYWMLIDTAGLHAPGSRRNSRTSRLPLGKADSSRSSFAAPDALPVSRGPGSGTVPGWNALAFDACARMTDPQCRRNALQSRRPTGRNAAFIASRLGRNRDGIAGRGGSIFGNRSAGARKEIGAGRRRRSRRRSVKADQSAAAWPMNR